MPLQISGLMSNPGLLRNFTEVRCQISDFWLLASYLCHLFSVLCFLYFGPLSMALSTLRV
jgi:hypothetical protein